MTSSPLAFQDGRVRRDHSPRLAQVGRRSLGVVSAICAIGLSGCQSVIEPVVPAGAAAYESITPPRDQLQRAYTLSPGDEVGVAVYGEKELSLDRIEIDDTGHLNLPLVGQIAVAGKTPMEATTLIEDAYRRDFVRDPRVNVSLIKGAGGMVTVEGEVKAPNVYPIRPGYTLLSAMALAGSPLPTARADHVLIFRNIGEQHMGGRFDLKGIRSGQVEDPLVRDGDVIVVGFSRKAGLYQDLIKLAPLLNVFVLLDRNGS